MPTKKAKVEQAEAGDLNLLSLAFKLKNSQKVLQLPEELTANYSINSSLPELEVPVIVLGVSTAEEKHPSFCLSRNEWVARVCVSFKGIVRVEEDGSAGNSVENSASFAEVDLLYKILLMHLQQHLHLRVKDKSKHNKYAINWFQLNLSRICILFLSNHLTSDLASTT